MIYLTKYMNHYRTYKTLLWPAVVLIICQIWSVHAQETPAYNENADLITLNFVNADLEGVVKVVSEITGKSFVIDPRVKGTVNIISSNPLPRELVYEVLLSALRLQGFVAVEDRDFVRIIPEVDAKLHPSPTSGPQDLTATQGDRIETRVFTLEHESAVQMVSVLRPLIAPNNSITAYQNSNALVITDYANNLQRLARIIHSIDQSSGADPVVIPLQHASAMDMAVSVRRMFAEASQSQAATAMDPTRHFTVAVDARSNSLLVSSGDPNRLNRVRNFVAKLDAPTSVTGNVHVVYLKNAEAVILAETLRAIYQGHTSTAASAGLATPTSAADDAASAGTDRSPVGIVQADVGTNSIIITASDTVYNGLRAAIDKLDVRRAQVYVEALVVELTADRASELGIQFQSLKGPDNDDTRGFGGTNFGGPGQNIIGISQNPATAGRGLNIGVVDGLVNIPGVGQIINLGVLVRALETDADANILSTPTLLTLDNEEASIIIGQNVPFITGQFSSLDGAVQNSTPFQTIERQDVGLTLQVKPQISEGGTVRLKIYQEVSNVQDTTNPAGLITNKRAVESTVLVDDGQTVVIGGLIQDSGNNNVQKIPILGDIPVLGALFRFKSLSQVKTNLMVFLRPTIVRDRQRADSFTNDRYEYIINEQERNRPGEDPILLNRETPALPSDIDAWPNLNEEKD